MSARWLPKSVTAQIVCAAAIALLIAQLLNFALLMRAREQQSVIIASSFAIARLADSIERLNGEASGGGEEEDHHHHHGKGRHDPYYSAAPPLSATAERQEELEKRAGAMMRQNGLSFRDLRIIIAPHAQLPAGLDHRPPRSMGGPQPIARHLGPVTNKIPPDDADDRVIVATVRLADGRWMSHAVPLMPRETIVYGWLLFQTFVLYLAVLLPLAFVAHRVARPLRRLTGKVRGLSFPADQPLLPEQGPDDVRRLIAAFNDMQARVAALLSEKDVMLGAIGHDLKTPLASLRIRIESVEDEEERDRMAATIDEMVMILDDILMLARLGKSGEAVEVTDLGALVATVVDEYADNGGNVAFAAPPDHLAVALRPVLIRRALRNLIGNALLYGGAARVMVEKAGAKGAPRIAIHVDDDGPGLAPANLTRMFEPFVRAEGSRNRATGGTGLGLTIARAIARAHGGDVILENRVDGGEKEGGEKGGLRATLWLPA